jgi:hypothetical protein
MSKTLLRHTLIKKIFLTFLLTPYLYTFSLYENPSFIIFSAETEYIWTRSKGTQYITRVKFGLKIVIKIIRIGHYEFKIMGVGLLHCIMGKSHTQSVGILH